MLCLFGFAFAMFAGYNLGDTISIELIDEITGGLPNIMGFDIIQIFFLIIRRNITASFLAIILGIVGGIPPLLIMVFNGFFIGHTVYNSALVLGLGLATMTLIPHGIIEIPTVLLSSAAGMSLGYAVINRIRGQGSLKEEFGKARLLFITKIIPLLILAGTIESILIAILLYLGSTA